MLLLLLPLTRICRRVIQYVAWADSSPKPGRDHGTWCGGAAVGKCLNTSSPASAYNGLAHEAKITVFDVDDNDNWLVVPSLYDISLPPAYDAGKYYMRLMSLFVEIYISGI